MEYLKRDLLVLHKVISKANKQTFLDYGIELLDNLTISGLAMKIFLNKYYNNNIPNINKRSLYNDIKLSYYGGITEVYKPYGENLFYYDVNSLYPYAALINDMPALGCYKEEFINIPSDLYSLFGFYYCNVKSSSNAYLGLLPVREKGGLHFPLGNWTGWYFSE